MSRRDDEAGRVGREIGEEISRAIRATPPPVTVKPTSPEVPPEVELVMLKRCENCQSPGGPLGAVAARVDKLRVSSYRQNGALALLAILGPLFLGIWLDRRSDDRLQKQIDVAAEVARQLKAVQDARPGASLEMAEPAPYQFATVLP